ncbi:amidase [Pseudomonas capsici]|uniref:amidase n=1 Tax=Pseudomonas capsici TaxID=2810614 RepID=UPI0021F1A92D|nr:amidase [Pseudomonas capsici]MCV4281382.1 amidase [Pseudomonas capsici]
MSTRRMFILRRPFTSLLLLILFVVAVLAWQYRVALQAFPTIISAYTAKEYCSCRYVMNNPAEYCRSYVKQYVPATLTDDPPAKSVIASGLGRSSVAAWQGVRQGCRLQPEKP